ncbi:unnamed protein product [Onchocerca flexuosa]|uniref:ATP-dependent DNA helicase n=1 Tax=Onchocerca flexuosa TaxID=387005 RepID=A0A183H4R5_9BILA|nr:unnamed protein product [Onchocerca flexuosa]
MTHGYCGILNPNSPCMIDEKCSRQYPRASVSNTVTGNYGYPLYRRRPTEDGGKLTTIQMRKDDFELYNRWRHAVFGVHPQKSDRNEVLNIDEIAQYQAKRHISSNKVMLRIDAPGETGKTFLIRLILAAIRSKMTPLLPGIRTTHCVLKLPLSMQFIGILTCNISITSGMGLG